MKSVPFSIAGLKGEAWRSSFEWPVAYPELRNELLHPTRNLMTAIREHKGHVRNVMALGLSRLPNLACALLEVVRTCEAAQASGIRLTGADEVQQWLSGESDGLLAGLYRNATALSVPEWMEARRIARLLTWNPLHRLIKAALSPHAVMITHNPLAVRHARMSAGAVGMRHADAVLARAREKASVRGSLDWTALAECVARRLVTGSNCSPQSISLVVRELTRLARQNLEQANFDLQALAGTKLPRWVWSGTAGGWSSRAIGLAVLGQGGDVTRFDHGGSVCLVDDPDFLDLSELCASSEFVCTTDAMAQICRSDILPSIQGSSCRVTGGAGDPSFAVTVGKAVRRSRPNVLYATTVFRGLRQYHYGLLPDPVYLDWQLRILRVLSRQDARVMFKPHPEGLLKTLADHPASAGYPVASRPFESYIDEADIFVFDYAHTTTFWKALCTGKPVILLDLGNNALSPRMRIMLRECNVRVIAASYNDSGLPFVNEESLADALRNAAGVDCRPFRQLFVGEGGVV